MDEHQYLDKHSCTQGSTHSKSDHNKKLFSTCSKPNIQIQSTTLSSPLEMAMSSSWKHCVNQSYTKECPSLVNHPTKDTQN